MRGGKRGFFAAGLHQIGDRKRQVSRLACETDLKRSHHLSAGRRGSQPTAEIAEHRELPLTDHLLGHFGDDA